MTIRVHSRPPNADLYDLYWKYHQDNDDIKQFSPNRRKVVREFISPSFVVDKSVMDLCCGRGRLSAGCLDYGASKMTCVDGSYMALEAAKENLASIDYEAELVQVDVEKLGSAFEPESFDTILMLYALQHQRDFRQVITDMYSLVKPGGIVAFNFFQRGVTSQVTRDLRDVFLKHDVSLVFEFLVDVGHLNHLPATNPFVLQDVVSGEAPDKYGAIVPDLQQAIGKYGLKAVQARLHLEDFGTPYVHNFDSSEIHKFVKSCGFEMVQSGANRVVARKKGVRDATK